MLAYNILFIKRGGDILLLNRDKPAWMGCWNGIGGKLEDDETPRDSMLRELREETDLDPHELQLQYKGMITWTVDDASFGGMYLYLGELPDRFLYPTPRKTDEGILDWKPIPWILDPNNRGLAANVPKSLATMLHDAGCYEHQCAYRNGVLIRHDLEPISPLLETDAALRDGYLRSRQQKGTGYAAAGTGTAIPLIRVKGDS